MIKVRTSERTLIFYKKLQWDSFGSKTPDDGPMRPEHVVRENSNMH
jgi:hypothetical protein